MKWLAKLISWLKPKKRFCPNCGSELGEIGYTGYAGCSNCPYHE